MRNRVVGTVALVTVVLALLASVVLAKQSAQANRTANVSGPLTITTPEPLPPFVQGVAYNLQLTAEGGKQPYYWRVAACNKLISIPESGENWQPCTGPLPPGIQLSSGGVLSGTPTDAGKFTLTFEVTSD